MPAPHADPAPAFWRCSPGRRLPAYARDLADARATAFTYLLNGQAPDGNWTALFQPGERVRLRLINASAMTYFDFRIPGLKLTVIAANPLSRRGAARMRFTIEVQGVQQIQRAVQLVHEVKGVTDVERG